MKPRITFDTLFANPFRTLEPVRGQYRTAKEIRYSTYEDTDTLRAGVILKFVKWASDSEALFQFVDAQGNAAPIRRGSYTYRYIAIDVLYGGTYSSRQRYTNNLGELLALINKGGFKTWFTSGVPAREIDPKDPMNINKFRCTNPALSLVVASGVDILTVIVCSGVSVNTIMSEVKTRTEGKLPARLTLVDTSTGAVLEVLDMAMQKKTVIVEELTFS